MSTGSASNDPDLTVLIVDDEPQIIEFLRMGFSYEGFRVLTATTGPEAINRTLEHHPNIIILDIMLPGMDGLEVTRRIRRTMNVPIIMLTAKDEVDDLVTGLNMGADDYVTKPFTFKELMARTRALLRRFGITTGDVLSFHNITLDRGTRVVTRNNEEIELTPREFDLLELLLMHPRQVLSREVILARVWGYDYEGDDNIIEVYIRHLREKLHDNPPQLIQTVRGIGYSLRG
ncbi:MAG TPA: response regulator transcription factor [Ktedonobacteraceae bacterium]|nr:response regulator transcription factor [Ktedonobacteraceae bacterium]